MQKRQLKIKLSVIIVMAMLMTIISPFIPEMSKTAIAATTVTVSDGETLDLSAIIEINPVVTVDAGATATLTGAKQCTIVCGEGVNLTIDNLGNNYTVCTIAFTGTGNTLDLVGTSYFKSSSNEPAIKVESPAKLNIKSTTGDGEVIANASGDGAAIGGASGNDAGGIYIYSGIVRATSALGRGASIGGGANANGGAMISGGEVYTMTPPYFDAMDIGHGDGYAGFSVWIIRDEGKVYLSKNQSLEPHNLSDGTHALFSSSAIDGLPSAYAYLPKVIEIGDIFINNIGNTVDLNNHFDEALDRIEINTTQPVTIKDSAPQARDVQIVSMTNGVQLTIEDVNLDVSGTTNAYALNFKGTGNTLTLVGDSSFTSGNNAPGIKVEGSTELTITSATNGSVSANGGANSAGIGGGNGSNGGTVNINSGRVYATGNSGHDIGAGNGVTDGALNISGDAAVFLKNDSCVTPVTTHDHATVSSVTDNKIYGVSANGWLPNFGVYMDLTTLSYDANDENDVTGTLPNPVTQHIGTTTTVTDNETLSRDKYILHSDWNTQSNGNGIGYMPGSIFTFGSDTTLYAQWISQDASLDWTNCSLAGVAFDEPGIEDGANEIDAISFDVTILDTYQSLASLELNTIQTVSDIKAYTDDGTGGGTYVPLLQGYDFTTDNTVWIKVTAEDGVTEKYYKISVSIISTDATLDISNCNLAGRQFTNDSSGQTGADETNAIPLSVSIPDTSLSSATVGINTTDVGTTVEAYIDDGTGGKSYAPQLQNYDFTTDDTLWIRVTAEDGMTQMYYKLSVAIASTDATLNITSSKLAGVALNEVTPTGDGMTEFTPIGTAVTIPYTGRATTVFEPVTNNVNATVEAKAGNFGALYAPIASSYDFSGDPFSNQLYVKITAEDGITVRYYGVSVTVEDPSTDASITGITVDGITATGSGATYDVELPYGVDLSTLSASDIVVTSTDSNASAGTATTSNSGETWTVVVTAEDGVTSQTYTINCTIAAVSTDATLDLTNCDLAGEIFTNDSSGESGADEANAILLSVTIPAANQSAAALGLNTTETVTDIQAYADSGSGGGSYAPLLQDYSFIPDDTLWIRVTAQDGTTQLYYKLSVTIASTVPESKYFSVTRTPIPGSVAYLEDVAEIEMTLNGNTLVKITEGTTTLTEGTHYTVSGSTVTFLESYIVSLDDNTTYTFTFDFSNGGSDTTEVNVSTVGTSSPIYSTTASYNKVKDSYLRIAMQPQPGNEIVSINDGTRDLVYGTDYIMDINNSYFGDDITNNSYVELTQTYIQSKEAGDFTLNYVFGCGGILSTTISIFYDGDLVSEFVSFKTVDTPIPGSSTYLSEPAEIEMMINDITLVSIQDENNTLTENIHYTVSGSTVAFDESYILSLDTGINIDYDFMFTFTFSNGYSDYAYVTVEESTTSFPNYSENVSYNKTTDTNLRIMMQPQPGNEIVIINDGTRDLVEGTDYTLAIDNNYSGDDIANNSYVELSQSYMQSRELGNFTFNHVFKCNGVLQTDVRVFGTYTLTYNVDGTLSTEVIINDGDAVNIPDASKSGYTLTGWSDGVNKYAADLSDFSMPVNDLTLTAQYLYNGASITKIKPNIPTPEHTISENDEGQIEISVDVEVEIKGDTQIAKVDQNTVNGLVEEATKIEKAGEEAVIEISLDTSKETENIEVELSESSFNNFANKTDANVKIKHSMVSLSFDSTAIETINEAEPTGDVSISVETVNIDALPEEAKNKLAGTDVKVFDFTVMKGDKKVSNFNGGKVELSIPYTPEEGQNTDAIIVYYLNDNGELECVTGQYNLKTGTVNFFTDHFSTYFIGYNLVDFEDVEEMDWFYDAVTYISARDIVNGKAEGVYAPQDNITRAEFATLMVRIFQLTSDIVENYSDIEADMWYADYIRVSKANGILPEFYDETFEPNKAISREEMMFILYKALEVTKRLNILEDNGDKLSYFADADEVVDYAKEASEYLISRDIVNGNGNGTVTPSKTSTRAEVAQMLYNMMTLLNR